MSVSAILAAQTSVYQPPNSQSSFRQAFGALADAINSGNLADAQQAYSALSQLQSSGQGTSTNPNSPLAQALSQIGQDLQSNNLQAAQQVLSSLQQAGHHHHHGHHGGSESSGGSAASATSSSASSASSIANSLNITA
jgi:hypothetical protein